MAASVVGSTSGSTAAALNLTLTYPAGIVTGDLVLCIITFRANGTTSSTLTPPTGFTQIDAAYSTVSGTTFMTWSGYKYDSAGGTAASVSATTCYSWSILRVSGAPASAPFGATPLLGTQVGPDTTRTANSPTATSSGTGLAVRVYTSRIADTTGVNASWTAGTGHTEVTDTTSTALTSANVSQETTVETVPSGATVARTSTELLSGASTASNTSQVGLILLLDAAGAAAAIRFRSVGKFT